MRKISQSCLSKLGAIVAIGVISLVACDRRDALAQMVPDDTLGNERSRVTPQGARRDRIDGGARRGANLFHSFTNFNVGEGRSVYFANPQGVTNILSRVTGDNTSEILGTLGVSGNANLFFLNPNGIVFGPNAQLDVRGSFVATTADTIQFGNQGFFSANTPEAPPLLTVNPSAIAFTQQATAPIVNQSVSSAGRDLENNPLSGLRGGVGQSLIFLGGRILFDSGGAISRDGVVELAAVREPSSIALNVDRALRPRLAIVEPDVRGNIRLTNRASVNTSGEGGGAIRIQGRNVHLVEGSTLTADTQGDRNGGGIAIRASQLRIEGGAQISASALENTTGNSGPVIINVDGLIVVSGSSTDNPANTNPDGNNSGNSGSGNSGSGGGGNSGGGNSGGGNSGGGNSGGGNGGGNRERPSKIASDARGAGVAGGVVISTARLLIAEGGKISASTINRSGGGNIRISATEQVEISGVSQQRQRPSGISVQTRGTGRSGEIQIDTGRLIVRSGGEILASTFDEGAGGDITIRARESIEVIGGIELLEANRNEAIQSNFLPSLIGAETGRSRQFEDAGNRLGTGDAGDLVLITDRFIVRDRAQVSVSSRSTNGQRGGIAGDLSIQAGDLRILNGSLITVGNRSGQAGNLNVSADEIYLNDGQFIAVTGGQGGAEGAVIRLNIAGNLLMRNRSLISAEALNAANGGNITINTASGFVVARPNENNDIVARARLGDGGNIQIAAQRIFGLNEGSVLPANLTNDIDASSEFGARGFVVLEQLDVDPSIGTAELPADVLTAAISQRCQPGQGTSSFVETGRGGIPLDPDETIAIQDLWEDMGHPVQGHSDQRAAAAAPSTSLDSNASSIVEAQGWTVSSDGNIVLTATAPAVTPYSSLRSPTPCSLSDVSSTAPGR